MRRLLFHLRFSEEPSVGFYVKLGRTIKCSSHLRQENTIDLFGYLLAGLADVGLFSYLLAESAVLILGGGRRRL